MRCARFIGDDHHPGPSQRPGFEDAPMGVYTENTFAASYSRRREHFQSEADLMKAYPQENEKSAAASVLGPDAVPVVLRVKAKKCLYTFYDTLLSRF